MPPSLTSATALVLDALARGYRHGFDVLDATGLPSGTVSDVYDIHKYNYTNTPS